jgi:hypothetical protein
LSASVVAWHSDDEQRWFFSDASCQAAARVAEPGSARPSAGCNGDGTLRLSLHSEREARPAGAVGGVRAGEFGDGVPQRAARRIDIERVGWGHPLTPPSLRWAPEARTTVHWHSLALQRSTNLHGIWGSAAGTDIAPLLPRGEAMVRGGRGGLRGARSGGMRRQEWRRRRRPRGGRSRERRGG